MSKKWCKNCGHRLHSKGKTAAGTQRYYCPNCHKSTVRKRPDLTARNRFDKYTEWLADKKTKVEIAQNCGVDRRTLGRWFEPFVNEEIKPIQVDCTDKILIVDGYYIEKLSTVLIVQLPDDRVVTWRFVQTESGGSWLEVFNQLEGYPFAIVGDGQKGMYKAIKQRFPHIIFQRCQFHVIHYVNRQLTQNPESYAALTFKILVGNITRVTTIEALREWLQDLAWWLDIFQDILHEKTYQDEKTPTGRRKWHYTHSSLHAAYSHVKNALPFLFQYLKYPGIPNTSNRIEGSVNAMLQRHIDMHRGLRLPERKKLICARLRKKQIQNPPRNVP